MASAKFALVGGGYALNVSSSNGYSFSLEPLGLGGSISGSEGETQRISDSASSGCFWTRPHGWSYLINPEVGGEEGAGTVLLVTDYISGVMGIDFCESLTIRVNEAHGGGEGFVPMQIIGYGSDGTIVFDIERSVKVWGRCSSAVSFTNGFSEAQWVGRNSSLITSTVLAGAATSNVARAAGGISEGIRDVITGRWL